MMSVEDPIVTGYMFYTMKLDLLLTDCGQESVLQDLYFGKDDFSKEHGSHGFLLIHKTP